jgi:hypothetical protein
MRIEFLEEFNDHLLESLARRAFNQTPPKPEGFWRHTGRETALLTAGGAAVGTALAGHKLIPAAKMAYKTIGRMGVKQGLSKLVSSPGMRRFGKGAAKEIGHESLHGGLFGVGLGAAENLNDRHRYNKAKTQNRGLINAIGL